VETWRADFGERWAELHEKFFTCPKPVIGAIEGAAIAAGATLALACDFLVVANSTRLQLSETRLGLTSSMSVVWLQFRHGGGAAVELALNARTLQGKELVERGLALQVVRDGHTLEAARAVASHLA